MGKAAKRKTSTTVVEDDIEKRLAVLNATSQFLGATLNMGWRLAITVVVPIVGGVKIDQHFDTSPNYTLLGLMLAAAAGCAVVWTTVKEVNARQAEMYPEINRKPTKLKEKR